MRSVPLVFALLAGLVGSAISLAGLSALSGPKAGQPEEIGALRSLSHQVAELRRDLAEQRRQRLELEARLETLEAAPREPVAPEPRGRAQPLPTASAPESQKPRPPGLQPERPWFDAAALVKGGLDAEDIEELRTPFEETELARLFLEDRARREGWLGSARYREALGRLTTQAAQLRERLGDPRYDWYLYATGQPNRIRVRNVLARSPGAKAGLERGDLIVRYDDRPIFALPELRRGIARGRADEQVPLDILRGSENLRLWLPRGPLGIQLQPERVLPPREGAS